MLNTSEKSLDPIPVVLSVSVTTAFSFIRAGLQVETIPAAAASKMNPLTQQPPPPPLFVIAAMTMMIFAWSC